MTTKHPRRVLTTAALAVTLLASASAASASPVDLSTWTALTLNFPGGQGAGNWVVEPGNTAVVQTVNADPSFFLNGLSQSSYTIQGTWQVLASGASDDDFIGFAFGYQNSSNFYLFDWKQTGQANAGANANEGMSIKKYQGATGNGLTDLSIAEFWENVANRGDMTVLATNHSTTAGWVEATPYTFLLDYNVVLGQFHVAVTQGATTLWDTTVNDSTFGAGQFAFYNNSQQSVRYAGFTQDVIQPTDPGLQPVPEPASLTMLGAGLVAVVSRLRRRNATH